MKLHQSSKSLLNAFRFAYKRTKPQTKMILSAPKIKLFLMGFIFILMSNNLIARDGDTSGISDFKRTYLPKDKKQNINRLTKKSGDFERVYWTEEQLIIVTLYKNDTLGISVRDFNDNFRYTRLSFRPEFFKIMTESDSAELFQKTNADVLIRNVACDVYYDSTQKITAYIVRDQPLRYGKALNYSALMRLETEKEDFTIIREKLAQKDTSFPLDFIKIDESKIVTPYSLCTNREELNSHIELFLKCFHKDRKFPDYLKMKSMEGKVLLNFIISKEGKPGSPVLSADYFRYYHKPENITNTKVIERSVKRIQGKILKKFTECIAHNDFPIPKSHGEPVNIYLILPLSYHYYSHD